MAGEGLVLRGTMRSHTDMVTAIASPIDNSDMIVTSSRDKSIILWHLTKDEKNCGVAHRRLTGHSHFVQDVVLSSDSQFALSDRFRFSQSDYQALEYACRTNTQFKKATLIPIGLAAFVSAQILSNPPLFQLRGTIRLNGGKDGVILLWDLAEGKKLYSLDAVSIIHSLCFSPNGYWLCAATEQTIKIWDLESKSIVEDLKVDLKAKAEKSDVSDTGNKKKVIMLLILPAQFSVNFSSI
ncbi:hypothetical protein F3Y22_tig00000376pilonHSYRG00010 [Hibiscus syriacus]|uniref:Uncharacterized protein n=1 Tax=Hibiscus syriacus TaxID=106335 RepID=A0A6A3D718_HIBSY|nr:hypothetical protein F3Y22_tig00000376pilonHSYRG00010 [Hibiscus syriacus]